LSAAYRTQSDRLPPVAMMRARRATLNSISAFVDSLAATYLLICL